MKSSRFYEILHGAVLMPVKMCSTEFVSSIRNILSRLRGIVMILCQFTMLGFCVVGCLCSAQSANLHNVQIALRNPPIASLRGQTAQSADWLRNLAMVTTHSLARDFFFFFFFFFFFGRGALFMMTLCTCRLFLLLTFDFSSVHLIVGENIYW